MKYFHKYLEHNDIGLNLEKTKNFTVQTFLYYSAKDLTYSFGYNNLKPYYMGVKLGLNQKRNIKGLIQIEYDEFKYKLIIRDLYGYNQQKAV